MQDFAQELWKGNAMRYLPKGLGTSSLENRLRANKIA